MIFKKQSQCLFRKLKRKAKDSVKYKDLPEQWYLPLDYFFHKGKPKPKMKQKTKHFSQAFEI